MYNSSYKSMHMLMSHSICIVLLLFSYDTQQKQLPRMFTKKEHILIRLMSKAHQHIPILHFVFMNTSG
jgi:hypothetical protein